MERVEGLGFMSKPSTALASPVCGKSTSQQLLAEIAKFEGPLSDGEEIGVRLSGFGTEVVVHLESVVPEEDIITISGVTPEGGRVRLVQHFSQLNILFVALPKQNPLSRRLS